MDTEIICHECGMILHDANEYHPGEFCVLVAAGCAPRAFVLEAMRYVTPEAVAAELEKE